MKTAGEEGKRGNERVGETLREGVLTQLFFLRGLKIKVFECVR
jgi:hypothetical protein